MKLCVLVAVALALVLSPVARAEEDVLEVSLEEWKGSGVTGTAVITDNGNGTSTVSIQMENNVDTEAQPAHIHEGACRGAIPSVRFPLNDVIGDRSKTEVKASLEELTSKPLYINIHRSAEELDKVTVCGPIQLPGVPSAGGGAADGGAGAAIPLFVATLLATGALTLVRRLA